MLSWRKYKSRYSLASAIIYISASYRKLKRIIFSFPRLGTNIIKVCFGTGETLWRVKIKTFWQFLFILPKKGNDKTFCGPHIILKMCIKYFMPPNRNVSTVKCVKLYLIKFSEREPENIEMRCINIPLTMNPFTFYKYYIHDCYTPPE